MERIDTIRRAMTALLAEAETGYPEARHVMAFPRDQGFDVASDTQSGDIFQRAILMESLHIIHRAGLADLSALMAREADYLLSRRVTGPPGGWRYFPDLSELPPDADDLAQVIRALLWSGRADAAQAVAREPLDVLLGQKGSGPGRYETWIVPDVDNSEFDRQRWWIDNAWGHGADCEVIANLVITLRALDAGRYASVVADCCTEIAARQGADGVWRSTWYEGPFYPGRVCSDALGPDSEPAARWRAWLGAHHNADGGWGIDRCSDAQNTSLALLCLPSTDRSVGAACDYLCSAQEQDGFWPASFWIRMELGRCRGATHTVLRYGSRAIATGYALQALVLHGGTEHHGRTFHQRPRAQSCGIASVVA